MKYELLKQLKDAGFLLRFVIGSEEWKGEKVYFDGTISDDGQKVGFLIPALSELIKACGEDFGTLSSLKLNGEIAGWVSFLDGDNKNGIDGETPKESVAKLWLVLNK